MKKESKESEKKGQAMAGAKAELDRKRQEAAELAKIEEYRRDVPPGIEVTEAAERMANADAGRPRPPLRLYRAILKAQAAIGTVRKNGLNDHFKNRYATLDEVWEAVRKAVNEAGLIVFCTIERQDGERVMATHLVEAASGEGISCAFPIPAAMNTPQAIGSTLTYARRYTLTALLEIVTGDGMDDDGNAASGVTAANPPAGAVAEALGF